MIGNFGTRYRNDVTDSLNISYVQTHGNLSSEEQQRLEKILEAWDFYEGYHWQKFQDSESPQTTFNYCKVFVNKFVAFEMGKGFVIQTPTALDTLQVTKNDPELMTGLDANGDGVAEDSEIKVSSREKTTFDYLTQVWDNNNRDVLLTEIGQSKSITGDTWIKVTYQDPEQMHDPFQEYPNGKIKISIVPTQYVYPTYSQHDKDILDSVLIQYPIRKLVERPFLILKRYSEETIMYKEVWTMDKIMIYEGKDLISEEDNPYGLLPFVQIKNFPVTGKSSGVGDLEDIIPLNVELNTKKSDISEIIDYHSAPITLVFGAKIGNIEKGANKVWGGLPKDAKVSNLEQKSDLGASINYTSDLKTSMCEIGGIPETVLGGASAISNTSGIALQYINMPLIDRTRLKRACTTQGLVLVNKLILFISLQEGLISKPEGISMKDFLSNDVTLNDTLPKDELIELQKLQQELLLGLECRHGAMKRLGKEDISNKILEIDQEREEHPELFNPMLQQTMAQNQINSGMTNGQTPVEEVRKEITGSNGANKNT